MGSEFNVMRLVRDEPEPSAPRLALTSVPSSAVIHSESPAKTDPLPGTPDAIVRQFDEVQHEMDALRQELVHLRRRDETLNYYMQRIDDELRLAARLQQDFLPKALPALAKVRFHTLYRPAGYVSGDLYDVMRLDENHVGFYIADAVGHGMPAALLTMFIKHGLITKEIHSGGYRLLKPSETLERLNESLCDQNLTYATFATALYGMINVHTLEVTLACAGHPAPMLMHEAGPLEPLPTIGGLLGIFPHEKYTNYSTRLSPGDRLILYTDGIEVAFGTDAASDPDRWQREFLARRSHVAPALLSEFGELADKESGSLEPKDDLTVVVLEVIR